MSKGNEERENKYPPREIKTHGDLADLLNLVRTRKVSFVAYQQPIAILAHEGQTFDVPIGYLIPGLLEIINGEVKD